jgi:hypothetical protein
MKRLGIAFLLMLLYVPVEVKALDSSMSAPLRLGVPESYFFVEDEFCGQGIAGASFNYYSSLHWRFNALGGMDALTTQPSGSAYPNVICMRGMSAQTVLNSIGLLTSSAAWLPQPYTSLWTAKARVLLDNEYEDDNTYRFGWFGSSTSVDPPLNGMYMEKVGAETDWYCVTRTAGVQTRTVITARSVSTGPWRWAILSKNSDGSVSCSLSGVTVTNSTNVPTSSSMYYGFMVKNLDVNDEHFEIDYFSLSVALSRP